MGEITFSARQLTGMELREIIFAGFTFESIASGRIPFLPAETGFDMVLSDQGIAFAEADTRTKNVNYDVEVEGILGRAATQNFIKPPVVQKPTPLATVAFAKGTVMNKQGVRCKTDEIPTCNIVTGVNETFARDIITGHGYYDLLPASVRNGGAAKSRFSLDNDEPGQHISYDNNGSFPEWCGSSVSFSVWLRMDSGMSYLINRYQDRTKVWTDHHWKLYVEKARMTFISQNPSTGAQDGIQYGEVPAHLEWQFGDMQAFISRFSMH
jgi:hypothetical protein